MTMVQTISGAAFTMLVSALMTYAALEPVSIDTAIPAATLAAAPAGSAQG